MGQGGGGRVSRADGKAILLLLPFLFPIMLADKFVAENSCYAALASERLAHSSGD